MEKYRIKVLMDSGIYFLPEKKVRTGIFSNIYSGKLILDGQIIGVTKAKGNKKTLYEKGRILDLENHEDQLRIEKQIQESGLSKKLEEGRNVQSRNILNLFICLTCLYTADNLQHNLDIAFKNQLVFLVFIAAAAALCHAIRSIIRS